MDPLSVAGSIVGILAAAAKVVELVQPFVTNTKDAPKLAISIHSEVNRVRMVLNSLKSILQDLSSPSTASQSRASVIQIDHIVVLFTDGVLIFSELESLLAPLSAPHDAQLQIRQRMLWASKKSAISAVMGRMQGFLVSLSAILNIFQCRSDMTALQSQRALEAQISALLDSNNALAVRVKDLEDVFDATSPTEQGIPLFDSAAQNTDNTSILNVDGAAETPTEDAEPVELSAARSSTTRRTSALLFRTELDNSRVYRRANRAESLFSFSTSVVHSTAWSVFSGLSLADVSVISVIALPLYAPDIQNSQHYVFGNGFGVKNGSAAADDSSLMYECIELRRMLSQIPVIEELLVSQTVEYLNVDVNDLLWTLFRDGKFFRLLSVVLPKKHAPLPLDDIQETVSHFIEALVSEWDMSSRDCFTLEDLFGDGIAGFRHVVRTLNCLIIKYSGPLKVNTFLNARSQMLSDDSQACGSGEDSELVREFLKEERIFVNKLAKLRALGAFLDRGKYFASHDLDALFSDLLRVLEVQTHFLLIVEKKKLESWGRGFCAHAFLQFYGDFAQYIPYIASQWRRAGTAQRLFIGIRNVVLRDAPDMKHMVESRAIFESWLSQPMQRFLAYPSFLKRLEHATPWLGRDEQHDVVRLAYNLLLSTIYAVNQVNTIEDLHARIVRSKKFRLEDYGQVIVSGALSVSINGEERIARVYLFGEVILACDDPDFGQGGLTFSSKIVGQQSWLFPSAVIPYRNRIISYERNPFTPMLRFRYLRGVRTVNVTLRFPDQELMSEWHDAITAK